jgi:hypothetical protein
MLMDQQWLFFAGRAAVLAVAMLVFAFALLSWRRSGSRDMQRVLGELDESREQARSLVELTRQLAEQLASLESRLDDRLTLAAAGGAPQRGYDLALQMARNGAGVEEIVSASGVTQHEALLLTRLHNPRSV